MDLTITAAAESDAGEVLTVQRAAYVTEAQLYGNAMFSALTETLDEVRAAVASGAVLVARHGSRLVGAVRGTRDGEVCHVGRLVVAPDLQGRGIGFALLTAVEQAHAGQVRRFALFTGERSEGNLRLYRKFGYAVTRTEVIADTISLVHLEKPAPQPGAPNQVTSASRSESSDPLAQAT